MGDEAHGAAGGSLGAPPERAGSVLDAAAGRRSLPALRARARANSEAQLQPHGEHPGLLQHMDQEGRDHGLQRLGKL